jgi:putative transcriptional regulator
VAPSLRGQLLIATPVLREPTFLRSVIVLLDHDDDGAFGVVVNRPDGPPVDDVVPRVTDLVVPPRRLFAGGPVGPDTGIALGLAAEGAEAQGWTPVSYPLVSVDLDHDPALLAASLQGLRVFLGYAGWAPGQLEAEIEEGAWYVVDALPGDCFAPEPDRLWSAVLRRQGWPLSAVATCPVDPTMN